MLTVTRELGLPVVIPQTTFRGKELETKSTTRKQENLKNDSSPEAIVHLVQKALFRPSSDAVLHMSRIECK